MDSVSMSSVVDIVQHAAIGTAAVTGGLTVVQSILSRQVKAPGSLALSLGAFTGTFRLLEGIGRKVSTRNGQRLFTTSQAAASAAAVASLALDAERKTIVVSYAVVLAALNIVKEFTSLSDVPHIDLPLGALFTGPMIESWIYQSDAIATSQLAALDGCSQLSSTVLRRMRDEMPSGKLLSRCDVFHRGQTCAQFHRDFYVRNMKFAMRLHVPIYAVSVLAPDYKRWIYGPRPALTSLVGRYLRTCCCLTMLYQIPLGVSCLSWSDRHRAVVRWAGALTALALLLEHKHRRGSVMKTIAVYATGALAARVVAALAVPPKAVKLGQLVLLSAAVAVIFRDVTPDSSRLARMLFGSSGSKPAGAPDERVYDTRGSQDNAVVVSHCARGR